MAIIHITVRVEGRINSDESKTNRNSPPSELEDTKRHPYCEDKSKGLPEQGAAVKNKLIHLFQHFTPLTNDSSISNVLNTAADTATGGFLLLPPDANIGVEKGNVVVASNTSLRILARKRGIGQSNSGVRFVGRHSPVCEIAAF